jgi:hypothetical protein
MNPFDKILKSNNQPSSSTKKIGLYDDILSDIKTTKPKTSTFNTIKSAGKEIVKGLVKLPLRAATNIDQALSGTNREIYSKGLKNGAGEKILDLGRVTPIGTQTFDKGFTKENVKKDLLDIGGSAVEAASYLPFAGAIKGGYTTGKALVTGGKKVAKQTLKGMAVEGAIGGGLQSLGQQTQQYAQDGTPISIKEAGKAAVGGAVAAPALGVLGRGLGKIFNRGQVPANLAVADEVLPTPVKSTVPSNLPVSESQLSQMPDTISSIIKDGKKAPELAQQAVTEAQTFTPALASDVESVAIEKGLISKFEGLPEAQTMNMRKQADDALNLVNNNYEQAKRVAMGTENAPGDLRDASVFEAVKLRAVKEGDVATLKQLATESTVPARISAYAQQVKAADARLLDSTDPVELMQTVIKARENGVQLKQKAVRTADTAEVKQIIKKSSPKRQDWDEFIAGITCE